MDDRPQFSDLQEREATAMEVTVVLTRGGVETVSTAFVDLKEPAASPGSESCCDFGETSSDFSYFAAIALSFPTDMSTHRKTNYYDKESLDSVQFMQRRH